MVNLFNRHLRNMTETMRLACILLCVSIHTVTAVPDFPALDHIQPSARLEDQRSAAQDLIGRVLGNDSAKFNVVTISPSIGPPNKDTFVIKSDGQTVSISATSGVAAAMGFYHYLKTRCGCQYTWAGAQLKLPHPLPVIPSPGMMVTSNDRFRYYQNVCTVSYSMVWWNWTRWQREIDWMAMSGINLPLAFTGQEAIFQKVYMSMGMTKDDLKMHWGGPAFLAWARMGNIHGWGGPLPQSWIDNQLALQHRILDRMRALGMVPVLPGFAGHVPIAITKYFPNASVSRLGDWNGFNQSYCCTYLLDFMDPLFQQIGTAFIKEMQKEFGVDHVYNADSFNEMKPSSGDPAYLKKSGKAIYDAMATADPQAVWLMQGWLFQDTNFWTSPRMEALLTSVPQGRMIVLDLFSEVKPFYQKTKSYYGQPFIWCMLHNFGGVMEMYGVIESVNTGPFEARSYPNSTMIGTGLTPEGINQNEVMYEFMNENAIAPAPRNLTEWFTDFATRRYGFYDQSSTSAWLRLMKTVYNCSDAHSDGFSNELLTLRPSLTRTEDVWYDPQDLFRAIEDLLKVYGEDSNELLKYDVIDLLRNNQQIMVYILYKQLVKDYHNKDINGVMSAGDYILNVFNAMEDALSRDAHFLLGPWVRDARLQGNTSGEKDLMEYNARNQVTLWGPRGEIADYAGKQWSGLVKNYYMPRWKLFKDMLVDALEKGRAFNQTAYDERVFKTVEQPFTFDHTFFTDTPKGDAVATVTRIFQQQAPAMKKLFDQFSRDWQPTIVGRRNTNLGWQMSRY